MGRYKKYLTILLMFSIHMMPFNAALATTVASEGWNVTKRLVQGATSFYDGTKNIILNGQNYVVKGSAAITPVAGQVAKMIVRTGAVFAVDMAIKELIGAVDYVMDPANNRVIYYPGSTNFTCIAGSISRTAETLDLAAQSACQAFAAKVTYQGVTKTADLQYKCMYKNAGGDQSSTMSCSQVTVNDHSNPEYLPYNTVASQIIGDATAGKGDAKAYVAAVADTSLASEQEQLVPATDVINQLNNSQSIPTTNTATGTSTPQADPKDPTAPKAPPIDIKLDFPIFCSWAPTVCQAAQAAIEFPKTAKNWWDTSTKAVSGAWADVKDWVKDPENTDNNLDLDDQSQPEPNTQINFSTSCPAKIPLNFSWNGQSLDFSFDFTIWCNAISTFVYPIVVALGALHALYIVSGVREDG